ncbi:MAG TPA: fibronectin type III domain-containing protein [Limnochordales bacterium]
MTSWRAHPARGRWRRGLGLALWLGAAVAAAGCTPARILGLYPERPAGPVTVALTVPAAAFEPAAVPSPPSRLRVSLVKDARLLVQEQEVPSPAGGDAVATFSFQTVYEGRWEVAGELLDAEGDAIYAGATRLYVAAGETAEARLRLVARPALLRTRIDLTGYDREALVTAAGVNLKGSATASLRASRPGRELVWEFDRQRTAGTYDLQVVLYQEDGTVEYSREYQGVVLWPGKTTAVSWRPAAGSAVVVGEVDWVPAAPSGVRCRALPDQEALEVSWDAPGDRDLAGYRVYVRPPEGQLRLRAEVAAGTLQATVGDPDLPWLQGGTAYVGVAAVDLAGQESLHAPASCAIPAPAPEGSVSGGADGGLLLLLLGGLLVRRAAVVGDVEAGPLEKDVDVAADEALHGAAARGARLQRRLGDGLEGLEGPAALTPVLVRRHRSCSTSAPCRTSAATGVQNKAACPPRTDPGAGRPSFVTLC